MDFFFKTHQQENRFGIFTLGQVLSKNTSVKTPANNRSTGKLAKQSVMISNSNSVVIIYFIWLLYISFFLERACQMYVHVCNSSQYAQSLYDPIVMYFFQGNYLAHHRFQYAFQNRRQSSQIKFGTHWIFLFCSVLVDTTLQLGSLLKLNFPIFSAESSCACGVPCACNIPLTFIF